MDVMKTAIALFKHELKKHSEPFLLDIFIISWSQNRFSCILAMTSVKKKKRSDFFTPFMHLMTQMCHHQIIKTNKDQM